ncbi:hypothetical protein ACFWEJ_16710 [Promicromonospora sp. NPDC060204]|uniref:hypothetical protein n=1 Tax=Promicromonospora sp. NPDC060204 TaxID=3347071 RepID=UPI00365E4412
MTLNPKTHVPPTTAPAPRRRGTWSSAVRGVTAAGGALAVALLATACTQASAAVLEEPSAVPSVAADAGQQPAEDAAQRPAEDAAPAAAEAAPEPSDEGEPSPVRAAPSESGPSDQRAPSPVPATGPSDQRDPRPVPSVPGEPEQGLVVTG